MFVENTKAYMMSQNLQTQNKNFELFISYLTKGVKFWYIPLLFILIGGAIAFYKVRYFVPQFEASGRILVKDEYSSWGQEYFVKGLELVSSRNRLVNEIGIIKSFPLMERVTSKSPYFHISYYDIGNVKTIEIYKGSPFQIDIDSIKDYRIVGKRFFIKFDNAQNFYLSEDKEQNESSWRKLNFNTHFNLQGIKVKIVLNNKAIIPEKLYAFVVNTPADIANILQKRIIVKPEDKESSVLILSISGYNSQKQIDLINTLIKEYIQYGLDKSNEIVYNTSAFIDGQLKVVLDSLISNEARLEYFKKNINADKIQLKYNDEIIPKVYDLEKDRIMLEYKKNYYEYTINYLKNHDDSKGIVIPTVADVSINDVLFKTLSNLMELYTERERLKTEVKESNIIISNIEKQINVAKLVLIDNLRTRLDKVNFELQQINQQIKNYDNKLIQIPSAERTLVNIERTYRLYNDLYNYLLQKRAETSLAAASNVSKVEVLDWANNYRLNNLGINSSAEYRNNIIIALLLSFGIIFLLIYFNQKVQDKTDLEKFTQIPVVGIIGHNSKGNSLVALNNPKSVITESYRSLKTNISFMSEGKENLVVMLTSSVSGEGKSFTATNLASVYAMSGKKTVLVGADLRKPRLFQDFGLNNHKGLSNLLIHKATLNEVIQDTGFENLFLISSGPIPPNPAELLAGKNFLNLLEELKKQFEVVIIDTPPFGLVTDAVLLSKYADITLYIVRHNFTHVKQLEAINEYYINKKIGHLGLVINDYKASKIGYGKYSYGYSYGYGYGYYEEDKNM